MCRFPYCTCPHKRTYMELKNKSLVSFFTVDGKILRYIFNLCGYCSKNDTTIKISRSFSKGKVINVLCRDRFSRYSGFINTERI